MPDRPNMGEAEKQNSNRPSSLSIRTLNNGASFRSKTASRKSHHIVKLQTISPTPRHV